MNWFVISFAVPALILALVAFTSFAYGSAVANTEGREDSSWRFICDEQGGALILHGTNISNSSKRDGHPWVTRENVIGLSRDWGFNFVRYLIFWSKVEPEPGVYDDGYLNEVEQRLGWFAEAGIHVVLDMHQDLWGPTLNSCFPEERYNGAPAWATITGGLPNNSEYCRTGWERLYMSPDLIHAFDAFFDYDGDHPELQDYYAAMWAYVAGRFKDHPAVIGYDLMNEPWHGADLFREMKFDKTKMHGFIQRMINAIRAADNDSWIFFEPRAGLVNQGLPSYIPPLVDSRSGPQRLVYFPHIYLQSVLHGRYQTDAVDLASWVENRRNEVEVLKTPLVVGEWNVSSGGDIYMNDLMNYFDEMMAGWAQYAYEGAFLKSEEGMLRVYPQRIAGLPLSYSYDPASRKFFLEFETKSGVTGPTEIYIPASRRFPEGWTLSVSDPVGAWSSQWDENMEILRIFTDPALEKHTITVLPAD